MTHFNGTMKRCNGFYSADDTAYVTARGVATVGDGEGSRVQKKKKMKKKKLADSSRLDTRTLNYKKWRYDYFF